MKKVLRAITVCSGIVCVVSAVILGYLYLENIFSCINGVKNKFSRKSDAAEIEYEQEIIE